MRVMLRVGLRRCGGWVELARRGVWRGWEMDGMWLVGGLGCVGLDLGVRESWSRVVFRAVGVIVGAGLSW